MKRYISCAKEEVTQFCQEVESNLVDLLREAGVKKHALDELDIYVKPAGSGFRVTIQFPSHVFHGRKLSQFFYKRDADETLDAIMNSGYISELVQYQDELKKPVKRSSTAEAMAEARNSKDPQRLAQLSEHNAKSVRKLVANNKYTDSATLKKLARDPDMEHEVYYHGMDYDDLRELAFEGNLLAPYYVVSSPYASRDDLMQLFNTQYEPHKDGRLPILVSDIVRRSDVLLADDYEHLLSLDDYDIDWWIALTADLPEEIYDRLISKYEGSSDSHSEALVRQASRRKEGIGF